MQFHEPLGDLVDVIERVGAIGVTRELHTLPAGQILIDGVAKLFDLGFQTLDFRRENLVVADVQFFQFVDLLLQLEDRFLKIEVVHSVSVPLFRMSS